MLEIETTHPAYTSEFQLAVPAPAAQEKRLNLWQALVLKISQGVDRLNRDFEEDKDGTWTRLACISRIRP